MSCRQYIDKKATGHKLYRLIKKSGMTYEQIAEFLGLQSPRVIYAWAEGENFQLPSIYITLLFVLQVHCK